MYFARYASGAVLRAARREPTPAYQPRDFTSEVIATRRPKCEHRPMTHTPSTSSVRGLLFTDSLVSGATGVLMVGTAPILESWLGLPSALLRFAGIALVPFAGVVGWLALQASPARAGVRAIIAANFAWAGASILLLLAGGVKPTALGVAFVIFQAVVVGVLGELQYLGLRRTNIA